MRYFKNSKNEVYAIEPGQETLVRDGWQEISLAQVAELTAPTPEQVKQERVFALQKLLRDSDYKVLPDYDKPNEQIRQQRQMWRNELRKLDSSF
jgi:hypothetical protein